VVLTALRGAVGFLTRVPVGSDERAWNALGERVSVVVLVGYGVGLVAGLSVLLPVPAATLALLYPLAVVLVTGINHTDGLADLGDAVVVHGDPARRRAVMDDTAVGVGGIVAVGLALVGLAGGAVSLATLPTRAAIGLAVAAEVGAKLSMVTLAVVGRPSHRGLGSHLLGAGWVTLAVALALGGPATLLAWPSLAGLPTVAVGPILGVGLWLWARARLGGVSGDVFGAANELARVAGLHAGVIVWTLS